MQPKHLVRVSKTHAEDVLPLLITALKDEDKHVRRYTAMALGTMGKPAVGAVPRVDRSIEGLKKMRQFVPKSLNYWENSARITRKMPFQHWWMP